MTDATKVKRYRESRKTRVVTTRLPHDVYAILARRARFYNGGISEYARWRLTYDLTHKHHKRSGT